MSSNQQSEVFAVLETRSQKGKKTNFNLFSSNEERHLFSSTHSDRTADRTEIQLERFCRNSFSFRLDAFLVFLDSSIDRKRIDEVRLFLVVLSNEKTRRESPTKKFLSEKAEFPQSTSIVDRELSSWSPDRISLRFGDVRRSFVSRQSTRFDSSTRFENSDRTFSRNSNFAKRKTFDEILFFLSILTKPFFFQFRREIF